jgi:hypothetical protein
MLARAPTTYTHARRPLVPPSSSSMARPPAPLLISPPRPASVPAPAPPPPCTPRASAPGTESFGSDDAAAARNGGRRRGRRLPVPYFFPYAPRRPPGRGRAAAYEERARVPAADLRDRQERAPVAAAPGEPGGRAPGAAGDAPAVAGAAAALQGGRQVQAPAPHGGRQRRNGEARIRVLC